MASNFKKPLLIVAVTFLCLTVKILEWNRNREQREGRIKEGDGNVKLSKEFFKVFHLDFKGGPPKLSFLYEIFPMVREAGANAVLLEYEDMFPFSGFPLNVSARNAYKLSEIRELVEFCESLGFEVIPLIQTFGHLEYVLKLEQFSSLRESGDFPGDLCPRNKDAIALVQEMILQIMNAHPRSKYVHIGCDEIRHLGTCPKCVRANPKKLFSSHVTKMADYVRSVNPDVTPLIWDDMLRRWTYQDLADSGLGEAVEPVVWVYGANILTLVPPFTWNIYKRIFPKIWIASAFKGASGETQLLPDLLRHLENNLSWMKFLSREKDNGENHISGIFITGWSRYDHFAALCELLPVSFPSLILSLQILHSDFVEDPSKVLSRWLFSLKCPPDHLPSRTINGSYFRSRLAECEFPGKDLYSGMSQFERLRERIRVVWSKFDSGGWTSGYHLKNRFSSPWRILKTFSKDLYVLREEISSWKSKFLPLMTRYFDEHTIAEWEEENVTPLEEKITEVQSRTQRLMKNRAWPRRPLR